MDDLISRQAVTKFLNDWLSCLFENCHKQSASDLKMIIKDFKNLPSAQPEPCGDVVSRNAIVQKLNEMDRYVSTELRLCDTDKKFPQNEVFIVDDVYEEIVEQLPSAQPEKRTEERTETHACDCISRQAAIDAHYEYCNKHPDAGFPVWSLKILEDLPTAQPERRWIPCKERLPENNDPVNVTWINHNPPGYYSDIKDERFTATAHYHNGHWYWYSCVTQDFLDEYGDCDIELVDEDVEIIAWMPLPESYNEK